MKPKLFIGSSAESRAIAFAVQENLDYDAECTVWTQGVFNLSVTALSSLIKQASISDFAVFIFSSDDITEMRNKANPTVRDNVIFETGLFIGKIGVERVYFVTPSENQDLHLPTDLLGISPGRFDSTRDDLTAALGSFCNQVRRNIGELGAINPSNETTESKEVKYDFEYTDAYKNLDISLIESIKETLPINGSINFIRTHSFEGSYRRDLLDDLRNFHQDGDNATMEFVNPELEGLRKQLYQDVNKFLFLLAKNTWVNKMNSDYSSVPSDWEEEQPERFNQVISEIHDTAESICSTYDLLIRRSRLLLAV
ncbi:nucleotide-binding protein [Paenibacillus ottowii]|uniref:CD-NTase-associated protein 12/Pycsar effector protein TIR domain-containing protein n=1 Tax=Paenibacillus ottowii TaxID=2315729 RepID=A0ABY3B7D8_9BACL|nr:nucleotide-binding protein [Paenibacillus ottowii]TQS00061.1 hypothetical protein FKV70_04570 [Paenibacillus ottowii]TQS00130.1 hypothetical protein FKV70_04945 [Paenibacillus ottowii]